jgi:predicted Zn-dependent protease
MQMRLFGYFMVGTVALLLAGCSSGSGRSLLALEDEKAELRAAIARRVGVPKSEVELAFDSTQQQQFEAAAAIATRVKQRYGASDDIAMQNHLQGVARRLAASVGAQDQNFDVVLLKSKQINAYTPGAGKILINEGLLQFASNEAQVAAVLAHEIAHVLMKHPQRQRQIRLASKAGGKMMDDMREPGSRDTLFGRMLRLSGNATMNGMIRQQELMADSTGVDILVKAGYEPREMVKILRALRARAPELDRATNVVYGNHPLTIDREQAVIDKINEKYLPVAGITSTPRFDSLVRRYHNRRLASMR